LELEDLEVIRLHQQEEIHLILVLQLLRQVVELVAVMINTPYQPPVVLADRVVVEVVDSPMVVLVLLQEQLHSQEPLEQLLQQVGGVMPVERVEIM